MRRLPQRVLHDLGRRGSESAALWNQIYARATPRIPLTDLLALPRLWGSELDPIEDSLEPYYWGFNLEGGRLPELDASTAEVDGPGHSTEVDLFLLGATELVLVEAKINSDPGRCARYGARRCPEIHWPADPQSVGPATLEWEADEVAPCRYWELPSASFARWLDFGDRPAVESPPPPCDRHYQLARTLLLGQALARRMDRRLHLWMLLPDRRWPRLQSVWLDFVERVRSPETWRHLRVISWEALNRLKAR